MEKQEQIEFSAWYTIQNEKEEGLLCQADAAEFLGVTRQTIKSRVNCGSLKSIEYKNKNIRRIYLSLKELKTEKIKRGNKKRKPYTYSGNVSTVPEENIFPQNVSK